MSIASSVEPEDTLNSLLDYARNGDTTAIVDLLDNYTVDINAKGIRKKNYGWTALHLASYFGHEGAVNTLLQHGADVNAINSTGDSPLHKAALSNRIHVVRHLISAGADINLVNSEGLTAKELTDSGEIAEVLDAASKSDLLKLERKLLDAAREGDIEDILRLVQNAPLPATSGLSDLSNSSSTLSSYQKSSFIGPNINCADALGNRPLHYATLAGNRETVIILLQLGADPHLTNKRGLRAADLTRDPLIKEMLDVKSLKEISKSAKKTEGLLMRKSRIRGYREHWIVLENGTLSLYVNKEAANGKKREKGGRFLAGAKIETESAKDSFILRFSNKSKMIFSVTKGDNAILERQKWINAFRDHIEHANKLLDSELKRVNEDDEDGTDIATIGSLQGCIENIRAYDQLLRRQLEDISKVQIYLRQEQRASSGLSSKLQEVVQDLDGKVSHLVGLSNQMCSDLSSCVNIMSQREELYHKEIEEEKRRNKILEDSLQAVAKEAKHLETSLQTIRSGSSFQGGASAAELASSMSALAKRDGDSEDSGDETAFYDCPSPEAQPGAPRSPNDVLFNSEKATAVSNGFLEDKSSAQKDKSPAKSWWAIVMSEHEGNGNTEKVTDDNGVNKEKKSDEGRKTLPVTMYSRKVSVWTIIKHCIGKDLSKITMPIVLNEPLTFLQKQAEYFEYCDLLHKACTLESPLERMECLAAYVCSTITSSVDRLAKPFNPLLGETYELALPDLGFRVMSEQVSHHPPVGVYYAESINRPHGGWKATGSMCPRIRFWGKSIEIQPKSINTLELLPFKEVYTWECVKVVCHNIIIGRIWLEYVGRLDLVCHTSGYKCQIDFKPAGWFGELHRIEGTIYNEKNEKVRCVYGKWTEAVYSVPVDVWEAYSKGTAPKTENGRPQTSATSNSDGATGGSLEDLEEGFVAPQSSTCDLRLSGQKLLWSSTPIPDYCKDYFNFSLFAMQLNETPSPELRAILPPTDGRLRPDVRLLEEGDIERAADEKHRLEEKQRAVRRKMQEKKQEWQPLWFKEVNSPYTKAKEWGSTGEYWKREFSKCPDIF